MLPKPIHDVALADLTALVGVVREGKTIEYKAALPPGDSAGIVAFVGGVSALANTAGGDFMIGIEATKDGVAKAVTGVACSNIDAEKLRLEQLLRDNLEPRLPRIDIHAIPCGAGLFVLVVRVHRSWVGPHRLNKDNKFYGRNSAGKYAFDVGELRTAFVLGETTAERIRTFRADRLVKITAGETPVPLSDPAAMVLHLVSMPSFADRHLIDVASKFASGNLLPLPLGGMSGGNKAALNLDGLVNYFAGYGEGSNSYVQVFRSGAIESVIALRRDEHGPYLLDEPFEKKIVEATRHYLNLAEFLEFGFPIFAFISLCGVNGTRFKYDTGSGVWGMSAPLSDDVISLPEVMLDSMNADVPALLRPVFDVIANAFGFISSRAYTGDKQWIENPRRLSF